ncbi:unnamed protein product [Cylicocyclus nassatus]|uniref:Uncharacterized protein n=1 Tax=Cylicocyclus nassatus TaxID=53992 RepID=A0AA36M6I1_CYLNA|nr:unnamed protein product [Cylicocyclus nassatus]
MRWTILLLTILLATEVFCHNDVRLPRAPGDEAPPTQPAPPAVTAGQQSGGTGIPGPSNELNVPPVLAQSQGVPTFDQSSFSSLYPPKCGGETQWPLEAYARCMPDINDIVVVSENDSLQAKNCPRVLICDPSGTPNEICSKESVKLWFPWNKKLVTNTGPTNLDSTGLLKVTKGELVMNVDPGCDLRFLKGQHSIRHRFQNKPPKIRELMKEYPGFYLLPVFHVKRRLNKAGNNIFIGREHLWMGLKTLKSIKCHDSCDLGQLITYTLTPNQRFHAKIWVDGQKCEWFKVCVEGGPGRKTNQFDCIDKNMLSVYVRNGFVVMPGAQNGVAIRFLKSTKKTKSSNKMEQISYRPTQIGFDFDGRFSIWSVGRELVVSSQMVKHDGYIIFYFSHHQCLIKKKGAFGGIQNMGPQNGEVWQIENKESIDTVSTGKGTPEDLGTAKTPHGTLGTIATPSPTPNVSAVAKATTTQKSNIDDFLGKGGTEVKKGRKGWLIWAIFYGFFVGSMISLLIFGSFLYFGRRNVYQDWYRGMYKRYGVDASGVTGGVTGSAFGTTTTGVGGLSTIGGTTMGATTGATTGGTTGLTSGFTTGGETSTSTTGGTTGGTTDVSGTTGGTSEVSGTTGGTDVSGTTGGTTGGGTSTGGDVSGTSGTSAAL